MGTMDGWQILLLAAGGYVAVTALVRLMQWRRSQLMKQFHEEVEREKARRATKSEKSSPASGGRAA